MASIVKRNKKYSVVYSYTDSDTGTSKQKWEACGRGSAGAGSDGSGRPVEFRKARRVG